MKTYIPALRFHFATGLYDPVVRWTTREATFKRALVSHLAARDGERILDLGCGTGTLAIAIAQSAPTAAVEGIDADEAMLARARAKQAGCGTAIHWHRGFAQSLPFQAGAFDAVASSLFFHHLTLADKRAALSEVARVVRPGGRLLIADWGRALGSWTRAGFLLVRLLDGFDSTRESVSGALPGLIADAGFGQPQEHEPVVTPLGVIRLWQAKRH